MRSASKFVCNSLRCSAFMRWLPLGASLDWAGTEALVFGDDKTGAVPGQVLCARLTPPRAAEWQAWPQTLPGTVRGAGHSPPSRATLSPQHAVRAGAR